ncbi:MAG: type III toxin-antitoxin system ToxN/AbiQ family toxin [Sarcina sp.]
MENKDHLVEFYYIKREYLEYLRIFDNKVSLKDTRSFVGVRLKIENKYYCIPLTSQVNTSGGKKRNSRITTFIKNKRDEKIACLLHNNMIPVYNDILTKINFDDNDNKDYFVREYIFIKTNFENIKNKADKTYEKYIQGDEFFLKLCCDFKLLEEKSLKYKISK